MFNLMSNFSGSHHCGLPSSFVGVHQLLYMAEVPSAPSSALSTAIIALMMVCQFFFIVFMVFVWNSIISYQYI